MPTRMKVANGLSLRKSKGRFKSKLMMELVKEWRKHRANMKCMNLSKSNHNIYDLRVNVVAEGANITSPNDSNIWPSSALVAKNSNSRYVLASKRASQPPTLRLENSLNTSSDFKCSKPSFVRNALPSKTPKASVSWKSKDDSNAIPRHLEQSHHKKTSRASRTHFKAMPNLIHKAKNVDTSNLNDSASGSRRRGQSDSYKGGDINTGKEGTKTSELLKSREVPRKSNILMVDRKDPNKDGPGKVKGSQDEVVTKEEGVKGHTCEGRATCGNCHKQANTTKTNDAPNLGSLLVGNKQMQGLMSNLRENSSHLFEKNHSRHQRDDPCEYRETNLKLPNRVQSVGGNGKTNDAISRRKRLLLEEKARTHAQKDLTYGPKKRRRYIEANEDEEDYVGDHHPVHIEDVTTELTPQDSISKHCVERQCYCCSKPIDIPRWSGIFKIDGKEYISLAGHLSSKSCEKVWKLSSLPEVVQVTKVPRMAVWPKIFKASKPTGDDIGLYFFPPEMRHGEELDQLVNEVMDKDLILRAVIGEAEMLIFPSVLLPERYQTFQTKHYLWAAFKAKEDKGDAIVEQEDEKGNCVSNQPDKVQSDNASFPSNHGLDRPSMEAPPQSSSSVFGIVVRQAPNLEPEVKQFIQEMERKGALVTVMRGEAIGGGPWPSNSTTTMQ